MDFSDWDVPAAEAVAERWNQAVESPMPAVAAMRDAVADATHSNQPVGSLMLADVAMEDAAVDASFPNRLAALPASVGVATQLSQHVESLPAVAAEDRASKTFFRLPAAAAGAEEASWLHWEACSLADVEADADAQAARLSTEPSTPNPVVVSPIVPSQHVALPIHAETQDAVADVVTQGAAADAMADVLFANLTGTADMLRGPVAVR